MRLRKIYEYSVIGIVIIVACGLYAYYFRGKDEEIIVIPTTSTFTNLGRVETGSTWQYQVEYTNPFQYVQIIERIRPSCSCTTTDEVPAQIEPGETISFSATIEFKDKPGKFSTQLTIIFDDDTTYDYIFRADLIRVLPSRLDLGKCKYGESRLATFELNQLNPSDPIELKALIYNDDTLNVFQRVSDNSTIVYTVNCACSMYGQITENIEFEFEDRQYPYRSIEISLYVSKPIEFKDKYLIFDNLVSNIIENRDIILDAPYQDTVSQFYVTFNHGEIFKVDAGHIKWESGKYVVPVTINTGFEGKFLMSKVFISAIVDSIKYNIESDIYITKMTDAVEGDSQ